ncbi:MAG: CoA-binding protein [Pseudomonadota bacterium]
MEERPYPDRYLMDVLARVSTIAAVGVSVNEVRPSNYVARFLSRRGYTVIPVNPVYAGQVAFGQKVRKTMGLIPKRNNPVDMVNIFRRSEEAGRVVDEALDKLLHRGLQVIWMQIGVVDKKAAKRAEAKGVEVLMNICPKMEYQRIGGELRMGGINTGIVSARMPVIGPGTGSY